ncbi:MAG: hypothetical protein GKC10_01375 [Methanosarcinales archaeon]|nr:hypothetical protein [Methanosarcinales archaeon]
MVTITMMHKELEILLISAIAVACFTMPASGGCSASCGTLGGGASFNFLGDPGFNGMSMDFQDMMRSQSSVTVGSAGTADGAAKDTEDNGSQNTTPNGSQNGSQIGSQAAASGQSPAPLPPMNLSGNWSLKLAPAQAGLNSTEEGELQLLQSDETVFGRGWIGDLPLTAAGSAAGENLTLYLTSVDAERIYRLDLVPDGGNLTGNYQAKDDLAGSWAAAATLTPR